MQATDRHGHPPGGHGMACCAPVSLTSPAVPARTRLWRLALAAATDGERQRGVPGPHHAALGGAVRQAAQARGWPCPFGHSRIGQVACSNGLLPSAAQLKLRASQLPFAARPMAAYEDTLCWPAAAGAAPAAGPLPNAPPPSACRQQAAGAVRHDRDGHAAGQPVRRRAPV